MANPIFKPPSSNPFGLSDVGSMASPTFADIDGDGDQDAFVGNNAGNTLFFRNTGTATSPAFAASVTNPFGLIDVGLNATPSFADIDGDGDLDAFVGNSEGDALFYRNTGTASSPAFAAPAINPFGLTDVGLNAAPTFADIDGDGDLDAFVGNSDGNMLFYRNTGTASSPRFAEPVTDPFGLIDVGSFANLIFSDINGDGDLDAFVGNSDGNTLFFRNTGTASSPAFAAPETNPFGLTDAGAFASPSLVDINSDGDLDVFVGNNAGNMLFYRNNAIVPGVSIVQTGGKSAVTEGGKTDTYTVVLNSKPTANVTIYLDTTNNQVTSSVNSLTFTPTNWDKEQTVKVAAVTDTVGEGNHTGVIQHTVTSTDGNYNGISTENVVIAIKDNDLPLHDPIFNTSVSIPFGLTNAGSFASPTFADIDSDGDLDAFIGNNAGETLFFRNTGTSSSPLFDAPVTNPFGLSNDGDRYGLSPTFADIDGDGDLDAFVGNNDGKTLFYRNTGTAGSAAFAAPATNPFGLTDVGLNASPTFADIDGDGDLDLFVGNKNGDTLFYRNTGTVDKPIFAAPVTNSFGLTDVGAYATPTFADLDGDGDLDASVANNAGNTLFFRNTGDAKNPIFAAHETNPFGLTDVGFGANPTFADLDGDGDLDAFVGASDGNTLFYRNSSISPIKIVQTGGSTAVNENGATDTYTVVLKNQPTANVTINLDTTNQQVTSSVNSLTFTPTNWNVAQTVTVTAVNDTVGEGKHTGVIKHTITSTDPHFNDIAIENITVTITDNDLPSRDPVFVHLSANPFGLIDIGVNDSPSLADIDGDGDLDVFVGNKNGDTLFYRNTGTAASPAFAASVTNPFGLIDVGSFSDPTFADIDGDGDLDAFVGNKNGNTLFYRNSGTASNPAFAVSATNPFGLTDVGLNATPTFADIDGDGDLDAFVGNKNGDTLFFRNTGTASNPIFAAPVTNPFGLTDVGQNATPTFADINGDGDLDAFVGNSAGNTLFFRNTGDAKNPIFAAPKTNPFGLKDAGTFATPILGDIDGDGDLDAFVGNNAGFYRNDAIAPGVSIKSTAGKSAVTEGGATDTYTVVLNSKPVANVTINLDTTNKQVTSSANSLTFTPANWNVAQTVTVTAVNDTVGEGKHSGVIQHAATSTDGNYNGIAIDRVTVAITDNDLPLHDPVFNIPGSNPFDLTNVGSFANPTFADIDSDGDLDAFVGNNAGDILFYRNMGAINSPDFAAPVTNPFGLTNAGDGNSPAFADIDGDGDLDVFMGNYNGEVLFSRNTGTAGSPSFTALESNPFGLTNVGMNATPVFTDIDGDGDLDAFVGNSEGNVLFYRNTGTVSSPIFAAPVTNSFGLTDAGSYAKPTFADLDGDGDLDASVGNRDGDTLFFRNNGTANSPAFAPADTNPFGLTNVNYFGLTDVNYNAAPTFADIDGDGDLDAFVGGSDGNMLFFQAPKVTNLNQSIDYSEDTTTAIADIRITYPEADTFTATVTLAGGNSTIGSFTANSGNGESYSAETGVWTVTGTKTAVNAALAAMSFVPAANSFADTTAIVSISDGVSPAITGMLTFNGEPVNDAPQLTKLNAITYTDTVFDDTFTTIKGGLVASDIDSNGLTYGIDGGIDIGFGKIIKSIAYGELTVTKATGEYSFVPDDAAIELLNFDVNKKFTVTVSDGLLTKSKPLTINFVQNGTTESKHDDTLTGTSGNDKFDGLAGKDIITGLEGDDTLNGGAGDDVLTGGSGKDIFKLTNFSKDTITDFSVGDDTIQLENSAFTQLTATGVLKAANFEIGAAIDANDYVIYNNGTGELFYDADGSGAGAAVQIAVLGISLALTNADFVVI